MLFEKRELIAQELQDGTGAAVHVAIDNSGLRSGLRIWFSDLGEKNGPVAELRSYGLRGHKVTLTFGAFAGLIVNQIKSASSEDVQLARALIQSIHPDIDVQIADQKLSDWRVNDASFTLSAVVRAYEIPHEDASIRETCQAVIVPVMAAMAELIGYDIIPEDIDDGEIPYEGAVSQIVIKRRERNPRNRLLCIRLHGEKCFACGCIPKVKYGEAGSIIEVHHLEPVSLLDTPRPYDPRTELVPLCPCCHRAVHTRKPFPLSIKELQNKMGI